jgi:integrase
MTAITRAHPAQLALFAQRARQYEAASRSKRTLAEYARQWRLFKAWCEARELEPLPCPAETLALWLTERAHQVSISTLSVALSAIAWVHVNSTHATPTSDPRIKRLWEGVRRTHGQPQRQVAPLTAAELRSVCAALPDSPIGVRDRVILTLGMSGALRRSELAALEVRDVEGTKGGLVVLIRRSKTDQQGKGHRVGVARGRNRQTCPVRALEAWLVLSKLKRGRLLRRMSRGGRVLDAGLRGAAIAEVVKRSVERVGLDAARYSGHSLRSGLATSAAAAGKTDRAIMQQGRWRGREMVDRYVRDARLLDEHNASKGIGL